MLLDARLRALRAHGGIRSYDDAHTHSAELQPDAVPFADVLPAGGLEPGTDPCRPSHLQQVSSKVGVQRASHSVPPVAGARGYRFLEY